jgi:hypothetical protein
VFIDIDVIKIAKKKNKRIKIKDLVKHRGLKEFKNIIDAFTKF